MFKIKTNHSIRKIFVSQFSSQIARMIMKMRHHRNRFRTYHKSNKSNSLGSRPTMMCHGSSAYYYFFQQGENSKYITIEYRGPIMYYYDVNLR